MTYYGPWELEEAQRDLQTASNWFEEIDSSRRKRLAREKVAEYLRATAAHLEEARAQLDDGRPESGLEL